MLDASHVVGYNETRTRRSREDEGERIMASFAIEPAFWELFPQAEIGIVVARGIDNAHESSEDVKAALVEANKAALAHVLSLIHI